MDIPGEVLLHVISYLPNKCDVLLACRSWHDIVCANDDTIISILSSKYPSACIHDMICHAAVHRDTDILHRILYEYSGYLPIRWGVVHRYMGTHSLHHSHIPMSTGTYMREAVLLAERRYDDIVDLCRDTGYIHDAVWICIPSTYRRIIIDSGYIRVSHIRRISYDDDVNMIGDTHIDARDVREIILNDAYDMFLFFYEDMLLSMYRCIDIMYGRILYHVLSDAHMCLQYYNHLRMAIVGDIDRSMHMRSLLDRDINRHLILAISIELRYVEVIDMYMRVSDAIRVYSYLRAPIHSSMLEIMRRRSAHVHEYNAIITVDRGIRVGKSLLRALYRGSRIVGNTVLMNAICRR